MPSLVQTEPVIEEPSELIRVNASILEAGGQSDVPLKMELI